MVTSTRYTGFRHAATSIVKEEGFKGLYKGVQSPLAGLFAMNAVVFSAYGTARRALGERPGQDLTALQYFQAGFVAGVALTAVEGPVDFVKVGLRFLLLLFPLTRLGWRCSDAAASPWRPVPRLRALLAHHC